MEQSFVVFDIKFDVQRVYFSGSNIGAGEVFLKASLFDKQLWMKKQGSVKLFDALNESFVLDSKESNSSCHYLLLK